MERMLPELDFISTKKKRNMSAKDVSITWNYNGGHERLSFSLRNDVAEIIAPKSGRVVVAFMKGRVFFKEDAENGYKFYESKGGMSNRYFKIAYKEEYNKYIGDYELKYDKFYDLYYVEKEGVE